MASLADIIAAQQGIVDGEAAALAAALTNVVKLRVLQGHSVSTIADLEKPLEVALEMPFETWLLATRAAGHTAFEAQD